MNEWVRQNRIHWKKKRATKSDDGRSRQTKKLAVDGTANCFLFAFFCCQCCCYFSATSVTNEPPANEQCNNNIMLSTWELTSMGSSLLTSTHNRCIGDSGDDGTITTTATISHRVRGTWKSLLPLSPMRYKACIWSTQAHKKQNTHSNIWYIFIRDSL